MRSTKINNETFNKAILHSKEIKTKTDKQKDKEVLPW